MKKLKINKVVRSIVTFVVSIKISMVFCDYELEKYISLDIMICIILLAFLAGSIYTFRQLRK